MKTVDWDMIPHEIWLLLLFPAEFQSHNTWDKILLSFKIEASDPDLISFKQKSLDLNQILHSSSGL